MGEKTLGAYVLPSIFVKKNPSPTSNLFSKENKNQIILS